MERSEEPTEESELVPREVSADKELRLWSSLSCPGLDIIENMLEICLLNTS